MKWISVKERLPEEDQSVLFYVKNAIQGMDLPIILSGTYEHKFGFFPYPCNDCYRSLDAQVTHWMAWPSSPYFKEELEENKKK